MTGNNSFKILFCSMRVILLAYLFITGSNGVLPEASQEGILRPFKTYSDLTLFHYNVPDEVTQITWEFAAFADSPTCSAKDVQIYLQHGSYPLINPNNSSFPTNAYVGRTSLHHVSSIASFEPRNTTMIHIFNPLPGNWFAAAYVSNWDLQLKQEGLSHKCRYSLGSVALWSQAMDVPILNIGAIKNVYAMEPFSYYKVYIPSGTWHFTVNITQCKFRVSSIRTESQNKTVTFCIISLSLRAKALPSSGSIGNITEGGGYTFHNYEPFTENYYYLLVVSEAIVSFNIEVLTEECNFKVLGRSNIKKLEHIKESLNAALNHRSINNEGANLNRSIFYTNRTEVKRRGKFANGDVCIPIFQLARIKHSEDFSDTFLLQGHGWFTHWIALTEFSPLVVELEILPYIDIGGTLSIGIHLDDILINATKQLLVVTACIRKGAVPSRTSGNITCNSELQLSISSKGLDSVDAIKLIPYPEPDKWFIAFQLKCYFNGTSAPCALKEVMLSLNVQTVRCAFAINPCGSKGVCQESHKGVHFLTSCYCLGGYNGWGCTDDSKALPQRILLLNTLLLTLSNIFFFPAVVLALRQNMISEAVVYLATMGFSTLYHACDEDFYNYCVTKYELFYWCLRCYKQSHILFQFSTFLPILPGIVLAGVGLVMFAFVETEANYQYVHSAWHVVIALSLLFLLPRTPRKRNDGNCSRPIEAELYDMNDCSSSSPVFVITSDLDNLLNT